MYLRATLRVEVSDEKAVHSGLIDDVLRRSVRQCLRMPSEKRSEWVSQARAALIIAATRRTLLTYGELGMALGIDGVGLRNHLRYVLDDVSEDCRTGGEDCSLAALVVNKDTGQPGAGWSNGIREWPQEVRRVFQHWGPK